MKRFFMSILAVFFPWLVLIIDDNPGGALLALIMQASIIGWIPASVWAFKTAKKSSGNRVTKIKTTTKTKPPQSSH